MQDCKFEARLPGTGQSVGHARGPSGSRVMAPARCSMHTVRCLKTVVCHCVDSKRDSIFPSSYDDEYAVMGKV